MAKKAMKKGSKRYPKRSKTTRLTDYARCRETHEFAELTTNTAYIDYATSLARCERASTIGRGYQEYKITKVEYHFIPRTDTFLPGQYGVPQLFFRIDKTASLQDFTQVSQLVQTGCKPMRMDDKNIVVSFKPTVLQYARDASNNTNPWAKPLTSPWLTTNKNNNVSTPNWVASSIDHYGLAWYAEQIVPSGQTPSAYTIRQVIHYEFRKPIVLNLPTTEGVPVAVQAPSINSPEA